MSEIKGKVIAITGASSGIGEATALLLAQKGAHVVLGARRTDRLEALVSTIRAEGGSAKYRALDVTKLEDVEAFVSFAKAEFGKIDVIINNAGIMPISPIEALKVNEWNQMIDVNIRGVMHGIAAGLPVMKKQGFGQFINVSSTAGHAVHPTGGIYSGTKFAVMAISEGLRQENSNIRVTVISPGLTKSDLDNTISDPTLAAASRESRKIAIGPDAIARAIAFAVEQPADVDVSEIIVRPTVSPY